MGLLTRSDGNTQARNGWFRRKTKQPKHNVLASPVPRPSDSAAPPCSTASPPPPYKQLSTQQVDGTDAAAVAAAADDDDIATTATAADAGETPEPEESAHVEQPSAPIGNMIPVDGRESSSSGDVAAPTGLPRTISAFRRAADIVPTGSDASASTEDCLMPRPSLSPNTASLSLEQWRQKKQAAEAEEAAEKAARLAHLRGEGLSEEAAAPTSGNPFRLSGAGPVALAGDGGVALSTSSMSANPFHAPQQLQPDVAEPTELTLTDPQLAQEVSPAEQSEQSAGTQDVQGRTKQIVVTKVTVGDTVYLLERTTRNVYAAEPPNKFVGKWAGCSIDFDSQPENSEDAAAALEGSSVLGRQLASAAKHLHEQRGQTTCNTLCESMVTPLKGKGFQSALIGEECGFSSSSPAPTGHTDTMRAPDKHGNAWLFDLVVRCQERPLAPHLKPRLTAPLHDASLTIYERVDVKTVGQLKRLVLAPWLAEHHKFNGDFQLLQRTEVELENKVRLECLKSGTDIVVSLPAPIAAMDNAVDGGNINSSITDVEEGASVIAETSDEAAAAAAGTKTTVVVEPPLSTVITASPSPSDNDTATSSRCPSESATEETESSLIDLSTPAKQQQKPAAAAAATLEALLAPAPDSPWMTFDSPAAR